VGKTGCNGLDITPKRRERASAQLGDVRGCLLLLNENKRGKTDGDRISGQKKFVKGEEET